jgi:3'(2'), 5'-bisphosphate nucleotidase
VDQTRTRPGAAAPDPLDGVTDLALAVELAQAAGHRLLDLRAAWTGDAAGLRDAGDAAAHEFLMEALARFRPGDAVLSEEAYKADPGADGVRLGAERVWIVDPLDGTREYGEDARTDWAVHVALWTRVQGEGTGGEGALGELTAGAVALPARGTVLGSDGAHPVPGRGAGPLRIAVSRTRPPAVVAAVAEELGAELVPMGSAGVKVTAVVLGEVDAYVHGGGQYEWDSAAPVAVALAAGAHASRLDGSPLRYNCPDPLLPDLVVARAEIAADLLAALARAGA